MVVTTNLARGPVLGARPRLRLSASLPTLAIAVLGAGAAAYVTVGHTELWRVGLATAIGVNLIVLGMRWPRAAALATLLFLPFLALIRRLLIADTGWISNDPLLLVGPVVTLFLLYRIYGLEDRRFDGDVVAKLTVGAARADHSPGLQPVGKRRLHREPRRPDLPRRPAHVVLHRPRGGRRAQRVDSCFTRWSPWPWPWGSTASSRPSSRRASGCRRGTSPGTRWRVTRRSTSARRAPSRSAPSAPSPATASTRPT